MTNLSSFILMAILAVGLTYFYKNYYFDEEYKKGFWGDKCNIYNALHFFFCIYQS